MPYGGVWREAWQEVLDRRRLIWIGADHSGNRRLAWFRVRLALEAAYNVARWYEVDPERTYAAGYSGGGRVASALAQLFPEVFRGTFSLFGCDYWRTVPIPHMPGASWPAAYPLPTRQIRRQVQVRSRFALLTGELDFNHSQTRAIYRRMLEDGFENVELQRIPRASHYHQVEASWFDAGIDSLDRSERR